MHFSSALATAIHYSRATLHKNSWAALDISWRYRLNASGWNAVEIEEVKDKRATLGHNETRRASQRNEWMVDAASGTSAVVLLTLIQGFWSSSLLLAFPSVIYCWRHYGLSLNAWADTNYGFCPGKHNSLLVFVTIHQNVLKKLALSLHLLNSNAI